MAIADSVLRIPRRAVRLGVLMGERAVEPGPRAGARLSWFAANVLTIGGVVVDGAAPPADIGAIVLPRVDRLSAFVALSLASVDAIGPSLTRLTGLGRVRRWDPWQAHRYPVVLLSADDAAESWRFGKRPVVHASIKVEPVVGPIGLLGSAARRVTQVRVRWHLAA
ncbi:MAG: hypothetical protein KA201_12145 [Kofleriaceae bacterium]|nr:hypothetical protein [Kofleriaceae bacterium]